MSLDIISFTVIYFLFVHIVVLNVVSFIMNVTCICYRVFRLTNKTLCTYEIACAVIPAAIGRGTYHDS